MTEQLQDWTGKPVRIARSKGSGVIALLDYTDGLMRADGEPWPPAPVVQKLYSSARGYASFNPPEQAALTAKLGFYSALQSMHSEDAVTWNFFGLLTTAPPEQRVAGLNWLLHRAGVTSAHNQFCSVDVWRRVVHPDTLGMAGPELDFLLVGDMWIVVGEAKWRSGEGMMQGKAKNKTQMQLRREFLTDRAPQLFGNRQLMLLGVTWKEPLESGAPIPGVTEAALTWADLTECPHHSKAAEFAEYYTWKVKHSQA